MNLCWNCQKARADDVRFCSTCGCPLRPDAEQEPQVSYAVQYMQREIRRWAWLNADRRTDLVWEYKEREARLKAIVSPAAQPAVQPGDSPSPSEAAPAPHGVHVPRPPEPVDIPGPSPAPRPAVHIPAADGAEEAGAVPHLRALDEREKAAASVPAGSAWMDAVGGFLQERNVRWFHTLGGLLLLAAGIGFLMSKWGTVGKYVITLLLLVAPAGAFGAAWWLRESLPLSSRALSVLGGLLLPTGLLALHRFGIVGADVSSAAWSAGAFTISGLVLLVLCVKLLEPACFYLGTIAMAIAFQAAGACLSQDLPVFGIGCLGLAFAWMGLSRLDAAGEMREAAAVLRPHVLPTSQALAALGLASTVPGWARRAPDGPMIFLLGAVFFATTGFLHRRPEGLYASGLVSAVFAGLLAWWSMAPWVSAAYAFLAVGTAFVVVGRASSGEPAMVEASFRVGAGVTGIALAAILGADFLQGLINGFARLDDAHLFTCITVALLATVFYALAAALYRRPALVYGAAASISYAGLMASVLFDRVDPTFMALFLAASPVLLLGVVAVLERFSPEAFVAPLLDVALLLSVLPGPLAIALRTHGVGASLQISPWILGLLALFYLLVLRWRRRPEWLYLTLGWALVDLVLTVQPHFSRTGLSLLPVAALLALMGRSVEARAGRPFAVPFVRVAWLLACGIVAMQPLLWMEGVPKVSLTLWVAAVGFGLFSLGFRDWTCMGAPAPLATALMSALLLPPSMYTALRTGGLEAQALPVTHLLVAAMLAVAWLLGRRVAPGPAPEAPAPPTSEDAGTVPPPTSEDAGTVPPPNLASAWSHSLRVAALAWASLGIIVPSGSPDPLARLFDAAAPALLWMLAALLGGQSRWMVASLAVLLATSLRVATGSLPDFGQVPGATAAVLAILAAGCGFFGRREEGFFLPAWVLSAISWGCILEVLGVPLDKRPSGFCAFNLGVAFVAWRRLSPLLESLAHVTAVAVLSGGLHLGGRAAFASLAGSYALAYGVVAFWRGSAGTLWVATFLAPVSLFVALAESGRSLETTGAALAVLGAAWYAVARLGASWPARLAPLAGVFLDQGAILALVSAGIGLQGSHAPGLDGSWALFAVLLAAGQMACQGWTRGAQAGYHGAYAMLHLLLLTRLGPDPAVEWISVPLGAWLLFWAFRSPDASRGPLEGVGTGIWILPSMAMSVTSPSGFHAVAAGVLGLLAVLLGAGRGRVVPLVGGSIGLVGEALLQIHLALIQLPWQIYAFVAGTSMIVLGIVIDRRRRDLLNLGQALVQQLSGGAEAGPREASLSEETTETDTSGS